LIRNPVISLLLLMLLAMACKSRVATTQPDGGMSDPDQTEVKIDTRFQEAFFRALDYRNRGDWKKAAEAFEQCVALDPKSSAAAQYELSRIDRMYRKDPQAALSRARAAVGLEPDNPWFHHELADVYLALEKYDLAIREYEIVEKLNPDDPNNLYEQAEALLYAGKLREAIAVYDRLEKKTGVYEELSLEKHQLYMELKDPVRAGEELEKLARHIPEEPRYWGMALRFYAGSGMKEKELAALEQLKRADPSDGMVRYQLSEYYAIMGDEQRSYEELRLAFGTTDVGIDKKIGVLMRYYALTEQDSSFLENAYELLEKTCQVHPFEAKAFAMYGDFLSRDGKNQEAIEKYRKAVELDPSRSLVWSQLVMLEASEKNYDLVMKDAVRAIEYFPHLPEFYLYLGIAHEQSDDLSSAIEQFQMGKELVVDNPSLLVQFLSALGSAYEASGRNADSDAALENALIIEPANVFVLNNYAYFLAKRGQKLEKALEMTRKCNELRPGRASFLDTFAWVLYRSGRYEEALERIEEAVKAGGGSDPEVLEHFGDILLKLGRPEEAKVKWQEALQKGGSQETLNRKIAGQFSEK
jgi:tetratricopeptide (TPR) repeat protein